ncbi:MAG TPA: flavin-dependent monooxygenase [Vicinamibacterales bacterium]|nr:flavin-dependent monooxygenase [Vicinamibacterales bacterium]
MVDLATNPDVQTLLSRARELRPLLQQRAPETDAGRRLPDDVVDALRKSGLCRLMVPKRFGGFETSIRGYMEIMIELGRGCGSTSWVASLINVCAWLAALFPEQAQREIWESDRDAWVAGSLNPIGATTPVDGGWRVTGRWPWASGCLHSQWAACGINMKDASGQIVNAGLSLLPMRELSVEDTWYMAGMRGTGSNTIVARDVFVPEHRFLPYPKALGGTYRTEHTDEVVYRVAFVPVTVLILCGSQIGVARAALDFAIAKAGARGITHTNFSKQSESAGFQMLIAEAAMRIDTAELHALRAADDLDRFARAGTYPDVAVRARMRTDTALAAKYCREAVDTLVCAHGTSSLADVSPMQRLWRDVHVASHHAITEWQVNLEVYGKALLGQENITHLI